MANHALATLTNPGSALTDFSLLVDLSDLPASWWSAVTDSDGTKGRVYKGDGTTRLAVDWIDFNSGASTGWIRVLWSGTLASSGTQQLWIEPPLSGNAAVADSDTYGADNAYNSGWEAYYPLTDANDRTVNAANLTGSGSISFGGGTGQVGAATDFDGTDDSAASGTGPASAVATYLAWIRTDLNPASVNRQIILHNNETGDKLWWWVGNDGAASGEQAFFNGSSYVYSSTVISQTTWTHVAVSNNSTGPLIQFYKDGAADGSAASYRNAIPANVTLGRNEVAGSPYPFNGLMDEVQIHSGILSADWIAEEYAQSSDNATFWGTWSWVTTGTGGNRLISGSLTDSRLVTGRLVA